ncbi:MAG: PIG-L family deacetylase, partial [Candidatus Eisenbacteria bacterium]|nr:PIG-L family deacetylase [Candidatus Eisenbacteria bacterium]
MRLLIIGAHPDDADLTAGGTAALCRTRGDDVLMVSVTDGTAGHHAMEPAALGRRRAAEARAAGDVIGAEYRVLGYPDGRLQPTVEAREDIVRLMRDFRPDVVCAPRPFDYHPDHRAAGQLVIDASYL